MTTSAAVDELLANARLSRSLPPPTMQRYLREQVGLSQEAVAKVLGVDRAAVSRWETGAREPRGTLRLAYAELLERFAREVNRG